MLGIVDGDGVPPEPSSVADPPMMRSMANVVPGAGLALLSDAIAWLPPSATNNLLAGVGVAPPPLAGVGVAAPPPPPPSPPPPPPQAVSTKTNASAAKARQAAVVCCIPPPRTLTTVRY